MKMWNPFLEYKKSLLGKRAFLFFALIIVFLFSCQKKEKVASPEQILRLNIVHEPPSLDPRKARDLNSLILAQTLFDGLVRINQAGETELVLAEKVEISPDGKVYLFQLKEAFWTNGQKVTAEDFAYSWRKVLEPRFLAPFAYHLYPIKGARLAKEGKISTQEVALFVLDEKTLKVELERPYFLFLESLSLPVFYAISKEAEKKNLLWAEKSRAYVNNGPFCIKQWIHHNYIELQKNENYWGKEKVSLQKIAFFMVDAETELKMFEAKELDWAGSPLSSLSIDALDVLKKKKSFHEQPLFSTVFARIRVDRFNEEMGSSEEAMWLRKALAFSINREAICSKGLQESCLPAEAFIPKELFFHTKNSLEDHNLVKARDFFKRVTRKPLPLLTISYVNERKNHLIAQALQNQWKKTFSLKVFLEPLEKKVFFQRLSRGQYQIALCSWVADFSDPIDFLRIFQFKEEMNNTSWHNARYSSLIREALETFDKKKRQRLLQEAEDILLEELPIIPLFYSKLIFLKRENVKNVFISPSGYIDFKSIYIDKED